MALLNEDHSSKLKRVFIELHNYSFCHGTSEKSLIDERFIGRERLLEKFKSILTNTAQKSGIYLITGYRGMGKTSFVKKALEEIYTPGSFYKSIHRWVFLFFLSFIITFFVVLMYGGVFNEPEIRHCIQLISVLYLVLFLASFISFYIAIGDNRQLWNRIINNRIENQAKKHRQYLEEFIIITFLSFLVLFIVSFVAADDQFSITNLSACIRFIFFVYLFFLLCIYIIKYRHLIKNSPQVKTSFSKKKYQFKFLNPLKNLINYSSTITVNLNLGYSDLKEINVLKLIARNIQAGFDEQRKRFSLNKIIRLLIFSIVFIFISILYNFESLRRFNNSIKNSIGFNVLFPSQQRLFITDSTLLLKELVVSMHNNSKLTAENYYLYIQTLTRTTQKEGFKSNFYAGFYRELSTIHWFDKNLIEYLDFESMKSLPYSLYTEEFKRKSRNLYTFLGYYRRDPNILNKPAEDVLSYSGFTNFHTHEFENIVKYIIESKIKASEDINLLSIHKLDELASIYKEYSSFSPFEKKVISAFNYIDYLIYLGFYYTRNSFLPLKNMRNVKIALIPTQIDYLFILYIIGFYCLFSYLLKIFNFNRPSLGKIKKKLKFINELIDSSLIFEKGADIRIMENPVGLFKKKSQHFSKADEREIEKYIIDIINDINELPIGSYRSKFIFVFDELDKIEPTIKKDIVKEIKTSLYSPDGIRTRQHALMILLSNLKYFLSTSHAKFVFIAGREMFDASLADISDRNFRIGSIFHDIFYLNSFYSDLAEYDIEEITSRTEQYVCQYLMPNNRKNVTLKEYNIYLKKEYIEFDESRGNKSSEEQCIAKQKREKIIYLLQQFIVFLNHQSAGAPSKIASYFENYVASKQMFSKNWNNYCIMAGNPNSDNLFLFFDFFHQYELGLINYLITPFNYSINKAISNYGDKLIVSASFLHNHLFKYYRNAFSWRDLEATPEIVDINKNPELRDFLGRLMDFMLKTHIEEIINGMYDFKFPKKISQEMLYLSHISEEASASFNFTLDESLNIKQHYRDQLTKLREIADISEKTSTEYSFSLTSMYLTLGDLCFYDGDYTEAITNYLEAIQSIRDKQVENLSITQLTLLTRNMLKLGYASEMRKTFDSAYLSYCEITDKVLRKIDAIKDDIDRDNMESILHLINYLYQPLLAKLHLIEKASADGIKATDLERLYHQEWPKFLSILNARKGAVKYLIESEFWNKIGNILYYKNSVFPIKDINGHLSKLSCPFGEMYDTISSHKCCLACRKYYDSLLIILAKHGIKMENGIDFLGAIKIFIKNHAQKGIRNIEYRVMAMILANISNVNMICAAKDTLEIKFIEEILDYINSDKRLDEISLPSGSKINITLYGYLCSSYLYRVSNNHKSAAFQYTCLLNFLSEYTRFRMPDNELKKKIIELADIISSKAIKDIYCSYDHIHNYEINRFKKIFLNEGNSMTFNDITLNRGSINIDLDEINIITEKIRLNLTPKIDLKSMDDMNIYNMVSPYCLNGNMFNRILKLQFRGQMNAILINSCDPDQEYIQIKKSLPVVSNNELPVERILDDKFKKIIYSLVNYIKLNGLPENEILSFFGKNVSKIDLIAFLISDSIFCYYEIIKICNTFDRSFSLNYSLLAESHRKLWLWTEFYNVFLAFITILQAKSKGLNIKYIVESRYKNFEVTQRDLALLNTIVLDNETQKTIMEKQTELTNTIENLIEPDNMQYISPIYQCEKAINAYYAAKYSHEQGQSYKGLLENMHYLNDDFNDELYHFSVALERYKLNCNPVEEIIKELRNRTQNTELYQHSKYIHEVIPKIAN